MEAALYLIPVPLGDVPAEQVLPERNRAVVAGIRHFIVESRKGAVRFLARLGAGVDIDSCTFTELSEHTDAHADLSHLLDPLVRGEAMGVISEAGCPCIGDPGARAVELAHQKGLRVVPLSGPNSMIMALMASGFNGQNFAFNGYLPPKKGEREARLRQLEARVYKENQTQLFIETPYRNATMLEAVLRTCRPDTKLCVAAGLTTAQEFIAARTIAAWKKSPPPPLDKIPAIFLLYK